MGSCDFDIKEPWGHRIMYTMGPWLHGVLVSWANVIRVPKSWDPMRPHNPRSIRSRDYETIGNVTYDD